MDDTISEHYAFVIKISDHPGGMELIAATFAHRGISLESSLGNDGTLDPEGRATVTVTFSAPAARKENIRRALGRLSRVRSLTEYPLDSPSLRKTAVFRMAGKLADLDHECGKLNLEEITASSETGESTFLLVDTPKAVDDFLARLGDAGKLRDVAVAVVGL